MENTLNYFTYKYRIQEKKIILNRKKKPCNSMRKITLKSTVTKNSGSMP
jgi:hypothetical protein